MEQIIKEKALSLGVDLIGFSEMNAGLCVRDDWKEIIEKHHFRTAISLAKAISVTAGNLLIDRVDVGSLFYYQKHVKTQAAILDSIAVELCLFIEKQGYHAFHIPGLGTAYSSEVPKTIISHMTHARLSGMGCMGDSGMIITKQYGPRIRLTTILTDFEIACKTSQEQEDLCLHCGACAAICPSRCIQGDRFNINEPDKTYIHPTLCEEHRKDNDLKFGTRFCNLCMAVCPVGDDIKVLLDNKHEY